MRRALVLFLLLLLVVGCEVAPEVKMAQLTKRQEDYKVAKIKPPSYIIKKRKPRIVVLPFSDTTGLSQCRLGVMATDIVQNIVASAGSYSVVERAKAKALAKEIGFQETHGADWGELEKKYFAMGKNIDYAIVGTVSSADATVGKSGVVTEVSMYVRIIDMNRGSVAQSFTVKGSHYQEGVVNPCAVFQKALEDAVKCPLLIKLREAIPLYGYVREIRTYVKDGKMSKVLFVNLGSSDGIAPGDKVKIVKLEKFVDPVTGKVSNRYVELGEGIVAKNGLLPNESMVLVEDPNLVDKLKIGYLVKATSSKVAGECAGKHFLQGLNIILKQMQQQ